MSFRTEILFGYIDANNLICNRKCSPAEVNPSGNGVCYSGEYIAILNRLGDLNHTDVDTWRESMIHCMLYQGLLSRGPGQPDLESVDDYYGFAAGCAVTGSADLAKMVLKRGKDHWGSFNNVPPGNWTSQSFLWRQPQLLCALLAAARVFPKWYNPVTWWHFPLRLYTAAVIATSCMKAPKEDFDSRRLAWLLCETVSPVSWICRKAQRIWAKRLLRTYPNGMKDVSAIGFEPGHPFNRYYPFA